MEPTEIIQTLVKPADKLIDAMTKAIGKIYEPYHKKRMADATAYKFDTMMERVTKHLEIPIVYKSQEFSIDTSNYEEILKRASIRLIYQEIAKERNIDAIIANACNELENTDGVSNEPVNPDWMIHFLNSAEDISDERLQEIWGRILAGEIKTPNSYSYRTLENLKNITKQEAEHFHLVSSLALQSKSRNFILTNEELMAKQNIYFSPILELTECGLMSSQELSLNIEVSATQAYTINNSQIIGIIKGTKNDPQKIRLPIYVFTGSGSQLLSVIHSNANSDYILDCLKLIKKECQDFDITAHRIRGFDDEGYINYMEEDILKST